jgi:GNAT superfamily N-acetyltransferase
MIVTEFLPISQFDQYGDWLKSQDAETQEMYFGISGSEHVIDTLMDQIRTYSEDHWILVARDRTQWTGTLHVAVDGTRVEFGLIVDKSRRGEGIASQMLEEAIIWARNRNYSELFMHCVGWNRPIQHLCHKHGLHPHNVYGDAEVQIKLDPPSWMTITKEVGIKQRNVFHTFLQNSNFLYREIYG